MIASSGRETLWPIRGGNVSDRVTVLQGLRVLVCAPEGPVLRGDRDAADLVGEAWSHDAAFVVLPVERLDPGFFSLATGIAGEIVQKFAGYRVRLAIRGDVSGHLERSSTFRAFADETNRGRQLWFVADDAELDTRLAGEQTHSR
jgi:hypothetical protein